MSKRFLKILTICSLVLVIPAIVVASAICLTAALSFKVSVDTTIVNDIYNLAKVEKIELDEGNSTWVKQGGNATITINTSAVNATYVGLYNGETKLEGVQSGNTITYTFAVENNMNLKAKYEADTFYEVTVNSDPVNEQIVVGATGVEGTIYDYSSKANTWLAKEGSTVTLTQKVNAKNGMTYKFTGWTKEADGQDVDYAENTYVATKNANFTGHFTEAQAKQLSIAHDIDQKLPNVADPEILVLGYEKDATTNNYNIPEGTEVTIKRGAHEGYKFLGWTVGGEDKGVTDSIKVTVSDTTTVGAKFEAIKYNITLNETKKENVLYGTELKSLFDAYDEKEGWTTYTEFKLDGKTYEHAKFGEVTEVALTAKVEKQSDTTYDFGNSTYNTKTGFVNKETSRTYKKLTGVIVGGTTYNLTNETTFAEKETLDTYLKDNKGAVEVELVWDYVFNSLTVYYGEDSIDTTNPKFEDVENFEFEKYFGLENAEMVMINIAGNGKSDVATMSRKNKGELFEGADGTVHTFGDVLDEILTNEYNDMDVTLTITFLTFD